jgi:CubicO group peptidase (beta-lactamase class C family)
VPVSLDARIDSALARAQELGELGIQVAAYLGEELIVDAWAGDADPARGLAVDGDTLFPVFSVTKAFAVTALHLQAERGLVDYDAPVARYWPEFGRNGKDVILVRHVLQHRSGVPHLPEGTTIERMCDWDWMARGIAELEPLVAPGTKSSYQAMSLGWLLGEVVRRTDPQGREFGRFVREELCEPLGIDDLWIGIPAAEEERVARLVGSYSAATPPELAPLRPLAMPALPTADNFNRPDVHQACIPGANGITSARAQARFWAMLANRGELGGVRLLSEGRVWSFAQQRPNPTEFDQVIGMIPSMGVAGYWLAADYPLGEAAPGSSPWTILHNGAGGSVGWADLESRLAVAICHNRMFSNHPPVPLDEHPHAAVGEAVREVAAAIAAVTA